MNYKEFRKIYQHSKILKFKIGDVEHILLKENENSVFNTFYTNNKLTYEKTTAMITSFIDIRDRVEFGKTRIGFYRRFYFKNNKIAIIIYYINK